MKQVKKTLLTICMVLFVSLFLNPQVEEANAKELLTLQELMVKFPDGKYWNHQAKHGHGYNNLYMCTNCGNPDGYTNYPCATHSANAAAGQYDCNGWYGLQCNGFVRKLATDAYGSMHTSWAIGNINNVKPGDIIHYYGGYGEMRADATYGHWVMVIAVNGDTLTFGECNSDGHCKITWHRTMNVKNTASSYTVYSAPYALVQNVSPSSVSLNKTSVTLTSKNATTSLIATVYPNNATDKSVTFKSSNSNVATVSSNGVVTALSNGTATITATTRTGGKTATCTVNVKIPASNPTINADGWYYVNELPSNITTNKYEIQCQNIYEKYSQTSPGSGWVSTGVVKKEYKKSGNLYTSPFALTTSETVVLENYFYYHYCNGKNHHANFVVTSAYPHYDEVSKDRVYEAGEYTDVDDSRYKYYHLKWTNGSDAYCNSSGGTCNGNYGTHGNRSCYWYKMYVYQNYSVSNLNLYRLTSAWGTKKDVAATTINYRYRVVQTSETSDKTNIASAKTYKITYKLNGGTNSANPSTYTNNTSTISLKNPTRSGYTFAGWYSDAKFTQKVTSIAKGTTGNKTLYAKWTANKYNIRFKGNGSTSGTMATVNSRKYGSLYILPSNKYKRAGYSFTGWNTKADGSGKKYFNRAIFSNLSKENGKTITLYAQWKKTKYKIAYHLNGGKNNAKNPSKYYVTTSTITLKNPTRSGYVFKGWYSDSKFKTKVTKISKGSTGTKHLYAKWVKKK